ncbi:MAG: uncharacterized protein QOH56_4563 [Pseudonocardiales bacterium]|jgi:uncharacterized protein YbaR (Trm112 family)|nr:hypothetical protein [Frankiales bacterium]MDQ1691187.1 uncharacterized protein [Pseudonocardiales bacterium]MDQ1738312.1 uncharacterized protein [Pseudonocardiales bacterium]
MSVSTELLAILACPSADHAPLRLETNPAADDVEELVCTVCQTRYPVRDGIPVLLTDDATAGPNGIGVPVTPPAGA